MSEQDEDPIAFPEEEEASCSICGKEYEIVRPGKSQPTCNCHLRCPCGRMKSYYEVGTHPTEQNVGGYLCPSCGVAGPCDEVIKKSLVMVPVLAHDQNMVRLLTYIHLGRVKLPIPFGHGFFFSSVRGDLKYSPWAMHALSQTWSMDADFPIDIPEQVDLSVVHDIGLWSMISAIILVALDGHPEVGKWQVISEITTRMETQKLNNMRIPPSYIIELADRDVGKNGNLMRKMKELHKDMTLEQIRKSISSSSLPWVIGKYPLHQCLRIQADLFESGGYTKIRQA
jgi:hypothetical protein